MIRVFRHYLSSAYLGLLLSEWLLFYFSLYGVMAGQRLHNSGQALLSALIFSGILVGCCSALGLYRNSLDKAGYQLLARLSISLLLAIGSLALLSYQLPTLLVAPSLLALALVLSAAGVALTRSVFHRLACRAGWQRRIVVLGCGQRAAELASLNGLYLHRGFVIVGFIALANESPAVSQPIQLDNENSLDRVIRQLRANEVVIAIDDRRKALPLDALLDAKLNGICVTDLASFYEREQQLVKLDTLSPSWLVFSDGFVNNGLRPFIKRSFDIIASLLLLSASWWLMLLTALAIAVESGWQAPIFYRQQRVGYRNQLFSVIKFRSMQLDAEKNGAQWAATGDSRVTRVGRVIRKYRIDELPQLFNVLTGEMSFVGPRPERPEFVSTFEDSIPYYKERHRVKPGITGWAQLCYPYGANAEDSRQKLQYDLYYVKNYSLFLDLTIMLSTVEVVLWGKGAR
jgi:sugar transferase (PEP-CTERM system associated)